MFIFSSVPIQFRFSGFMPAVIIILLCAHGALIRLVRPAQPMPRAISRLESFPTCQAPQFATAKCYTPHRPLVQHAQPLPRAISRLGSSPICQAPQFATAKCYTPHRPLVRPAQPLPRAISRLGSSPICQAPQFATAKCVTPHRAASPPLVLLASSLVALLEGLFTRLSSRSPSTPVTCAAPYRRRKMEPCFLGSALCERVHDVETGNTFYLCKNAVDRPGYASRKVGRGGRWVFYTTRPIITGA
jgi:hypothetical protein